jgi:mRNA interferase RelE/StbE
LSLEKNPRQGNNLKPLKGKFAGSYRYRVGDLRIVYTVNDRAVTVFVITIAKRSDVYE